MEKLQPIYLDYNATAPTLPEVAQALQQWLQQGPLNPSSQHAPGRHARQLLENAREGMLALLQAEPGSRLLFTSGGTEANNLALRGLIRPGAGQVVVSRIEHPSLTRPAAWLQQQGVPVAWLRCTRSGVVDLDHLEQLLQQPTQLVCVLAANNETGVMQPVPQIAQMVHQAGALLHTDAAQWVGKLPLRLTAWGADAVSLAGHKFGAPVGIGALILRPGVQLEPLLRGGPQEFELRPGTEPAALAAAQHLALQRACEDLDGKVRRMRQLRDRFEQQLRDALAQVVIHGREAPRVPQTTCVAFPGVDRQRLLVRLDLDGVACSTGSACASGSSEPSPTLEAMGCPAHLVESSLRFSFGPQTTSAELDEAARRILQAVAVLRGGS